MEVRARDHLGLFDLIAIEKEIDLGQKLGLEPVGNAPVEKVAALVFEGGSLTALIQPKIADEAAAVTPLDLPTSEIGIDKNVGMRSEK